MTVETWLAFVAATAVLLVIPGPAQTLVFEATFVTLAFANAAGYALIALRARGLVHSERAVGIFNRVGGSLLIGAGLAAATVRSSQ
jgi:threonine/homoserine/homoserine lactone efflux protein